MKRIKILAFLLLLTLNYSVAQNSYSLTGYVKDSLTNIPLENINVSVKSKSFSTITDKEGRFEINSSTNDTIYFSAIGYNSVRLFVSDKLADKNIQIHLSSNSYALKTVLIKPTESADEIVKKTISKLENTKNDKKVFSGYFYEYIRENNKQVRSFIADVSVLDETDKVSGDKAMEAFYINACNKSDEISKCFPELKKINNLEILFKQNPIRYNLAPLSVKKIKNFNFVIDSTVVLQGETYYAISYSSKEMIGQLLINTENYFIASVSKSLKKNIVTAHQNGATLEILPTSLAVHYKQTDSTITLESIHYSWGARSIVEKDTCDLSVTCQFVLIKEDRESFFISNKKNNVDKSKDVFVQYETFNESVLLNKLPNSKIIQNQVK